MTGTSGNKSLCPMRGSIGNSNCDKINSDFWVSTKNQGLENGYGRMERGMRRGKDERPAWCGVANEDSVMEGVRMPSKVLSVALGSLPAFGKMMDGLANK